MADISQPVPTVRKTAPMPALPGRAPVTGPISAPAFMPVRDRVTTAVKEPKGVDLSDLARTAGMLGQGLTAAQPMVDMAANTADAVAYAPDAIQESFRWLSHRSTVDVSEELGSAVEKAAKVGRVLGVAGAAIAAKDLYDAVYPTLDTVAAGEALANLALGVATAGEDMLKTPGANALLKTVGGVAGLASSLYALARDIGDIKKNGLAWPTALGLVGNALTAAGCTLLLMPGLNAVAGALLMVGASINLARLAIDNWDTIREVSHIAKTRVGGWLGHAAQETTGPPKPGIPPTALA